MGRGRSGRIQFQEYLFVKLQIMLSDIPKRTFHFVTDFDDMSTFTITSVALSIVKVQLETGPLYMTFIVISS